MAETLIGVGIIAIALMLAIVLFVERKHRRRWDEEERVWKRNQTWWNEYLGASQHGMNNETD